MLDGYCNVVNDYSLLINYMSRFYVFHVTNDTLKTLLVEKKVSSFSRILCLFDFMQHAMSFGIVYVACVNPKSSTAVREIRIVLSSSIQYLLFRDYFN